MAKYKHFSVTPQSGGNLITDSSEETPDLNNYTIKSGIRRLTKDQETVREGDVYFQPNQDLPPGIQPFPPVTPGDPILLIHDAIFPDGTVVTIVGTATDIFVFVNSDSAYVYQTGPDIKSIDLSTNSIEIEGDWTSEFVAGHTFYIQFSTFNNGKYTVSVGGPTYNASTTRTSIPLDETLSASLPDGIAVAPVYGNEIAAIDRDWETN